jgi:hypothetical protein
MFSKKSSEPKKPWLSFRKDYGLNITSITFKAPEGEITLVQLLDLLKKLDPDYFYSTIKTMYLEDIKNKKVKE